MKIVKALLVVTATVAPLAVAVPAQAREDTHVHGTDGVPTYTCDIIQALGTTTLIGSENCVASNGAPGTGFITLGGTFLVISRNAPTANTSPKQTYHCRGGDANDPGGYAATPNEIQGNTCW
jgi:hypothetical protein